MSNTTTKTSILAQLGPRGLKELKTGPAMSIYFQPAGESEKVILSDSVPRKIGVAFSQAIKDHLKDKGTAYATYTITTGDKPTIKAILRWMLASCNGFGIAAFEPHATFTENVAYIKTADALGISTLSKILNDRLQTRISNPTIQDARAIYATLDFNNPLRIAFAKTVAECVEKKQLTNWKMFIEFANENLEYAVEVDEQRKIIKAPQREAQQAARREENRAYWASVRAEKHEEYLARQKKRDELAKAKEEADAKQVSSWKNKNGGKASYAKIAKEFANGMDLKGKGRDVAASDRAENGSTSDGSNKAQSKTTDNTSARVTPEKKTEAAPARRPTVAVTLDLTNAKPTITIGNVTKEVAPTVKIEVLEEAANDKTAAKDENKDKIAQGSKAEKEKEGGQASVTTHKKKQKKK